MDDDGSGAGAATGGGGGVPEGFAPETCEEYCSVSVAAGCDNCACDGPHPDYPCPDEERAVWKCVVAQVRPDHCGGVCPEEAAAVDACEEAHKGD